MEGEEDETKTNQHTTVVKCRCVGSCVGFECVKQRITALVTSDRTDEAQHLFEQTIQTYVMEDDLPLRDQLRTIYEVILSDNGHMPTSINALPRTPLLDTLLEQFSCIICLKLLYEPVTTPCGHSFCRTCLCRAIDITDHCPVCRSVLYLQDPAQMALTNTLRDAIQVAFPNEYENRRKELDADSPTSDTVMTRLPLFPLNTVVFPMQHFPMHIFEARYRLMLRRVMQGSRKFGLIAMKAGHDDESILCDVGCVLEITKVDRIPDGRFVIKTIARQRFRVHGHTKLDDYLVARTEILEDEPVDDLLEVNILEDAIRSILAKLTDDTVRVPAIQHAFQRAGSIPTPAQGPTTLGLWLAGILVSNSEERQRFLEMRNCAERLRETKVMLEQFEKCCHRQGQSRECFVQ